jgi:hypothetical protein
MRPMRAINRPRRRILSQVRMHTSGPAIPASAAAAHAIVATATSQPADHLIRALAGRVMLANILRVSAATQCAPV